MKQVPEGMGFSHAIDYPGCIRGNQIREKGNFAMATVKDILDRKGKGVVSVSSEQTVLAAARLMKERQIGAVVVVEGEKVIGIFSERDISRRVVAEGRDPTATPVYEVMTAPVACCCLQTDILECEFIITDRRIRHLPVLEGGRLEGMVTIGDLLAMQVEEQNKTIKYLNEYVFMMPPVGE